MTFVDIIFYSNLILEVLVNKPYIYSYLIASGLITVIYLFTKEGEDLKDKIFEKIEDTFCFFWGMFSLVCGFKYFIDNSYVNFAVILLILIGGSLLFCQIKNIPIAALMSLMIASLITFLMYTNFSNLFLFDLEVIDIRWFFGITFIFISVAFYIVLRFLEDIIKILGSVVTFTPVLFILSLTSIVYGSINIVIG